MAQNIVSIEFSDEESTELRAAVAVVVARLAGKTVALDVDLRRELFKMGTRSEAFCRQALGALDDNRQVVPASLGLDEALKDQRALDVLRPVLRTLEQVVENLRDTEMALGSDMMDTASEGYRLLKVTGQNQGLDGLVKELGGRFTRRPRQAAAPIVVQ